ncbi:uncharacterized protein ARMOST_20437 [Armillaria ostoyae]|uniref:Uncharacterized protein n=1 Tax=Armillaria ostoyae TaxID=47428 RepID=A0A284S7B8_ARMOS|nr:uncharacterized protein ARMOST_20437 [Armillaria ostoyae]
MTQAESPLTSVRTSTADDLGPFVSDRWRGKPSSFLLLPPPLQSPLLTLSTTILFTVGGISSMFSVITKSSDQTRRRCFVPSRSIDDCSLWQHVFSSPFGPEYLFNVTYNPPVWYPVEESAPVDDDAPATATLKSIVLQSLTIGESSRELDIIRGQTIIYDSSGFVGHQGYRRMAPRNPIVHFYVIAYDYEKTGGAATGALFMLM